MSAGTGIQHSEYNLGDSLARFLQIWIYPDRRGHVPNYGEFRFDWEERKDKWFQIVSGMQGNAPVKIHQDANLYVLELSKDNSIRFSVENGRQAYLVQIEGTAQINDQTLKARDAMEIIEEEITIHASETSHFLLIEMAKRAF
jgi:hypothetical protein